MFRTHLNRNNIHHRLAVLVLATSVIASSCTTDTANYCDARHPCALGMRCDLESFTCVQLSFFADAAADQSSGDGGLADGSVDADAPTPIEIDTDNDGDPDSIDCAPTNPAVFHAQIENCNGIDDNCNGKVDEANSANCVIYYVDSDGDSYGLVGSASCVCAPSGDLTAIKTGDCNDDDSTVHPGATESCNGKDDDCDGKTDEVDVPNPAGCTDYYVDADGDQHGDKEQKMCLCMPSPEYRDVPPDDCNDANGDVFPGQTSYFTIDRGDGSFDYNCDGVQEHGLTGVNAACAPIGGNRICANLGEPQWRNSIEPACGEHAEAYDGCNATYGADSTLTSCKTRYVTKTQSCR